MKKIFILLCFSVLTIIGCEDDALIIEPKVSIDSVDFPFENRENGKFMSIYRNNAEQGIPISFVMASYMNRLSFWLCCVSIFNVRQILKKLNKIKLN